MKRRGYEEQKLDTDGIAVRGGFLKWLDNYWYHYKWLTIGIAFALIVLIVCTVQTCSKEKSDVIVLYAGRNTLSGAETEDICDVLEAVCPEDFDGNGKVSFELSAYGILSEAQIKEQIEASNEVYIDRGYNSDQYDIYHNYTMTGESSVLFLDPWLYEELVAADRLVSLDEALGYTPETAYGEYGVRLGDTALYEQYGVMRLLPEDTVICLLKPYVAGKSSKEKYYAYEKKTFEEIVRFGE
ncbi:MAG: hypothetical protein J6U86_07225 [Clostridia bacterium]|nr:hypothetical protein [Clostridia bacterium]